MEAFSPLYLVLACFATGLGVFGIHRGRSEGDPKSLWIGVALPILAWLVTSPGPLGFFTLVLGIGIFSDEIGLAWTKAGKPAPASASAKRAPRRPPPGGKGPR